MRPILSAGFDGMIPRSRWSATSWPGWGWRGGKTRDYPRQSHQWRHRQGLRSNQSSNSLRQDLGHAQRVERLPDRELRQFGGRGLMLLIPSSLVAALPLSCAPQWQLSAKVVLEGEIDPLATNGAQIPGHISANEKAYEPNFKFFCWTKVFQPFDLSVCPSLSHSFSSWNKCWP